MKKQVWLIVVILILAVVGYYFQFVSEAPLFGPRLLRTGVVTPGTGGSESAIPPVGINPGADVQYAYEKCSLSQLKACMVTKYVCPACLGTDTPDLSTCNTCDASLRTPACVKNPTLCGDDGVCCDEFTLFPDLDRYCRDDKQCCFGTVLNPRIEGCCIRPAADYDPFHVTGSVYNFATEWCCGDWFGGGGHVTPKTDECCGNGPRGSSYGSRGYGCDECQVCREGACVSCTEAGYSACESRSDYPDSQGLCCWKVCSGNGKTVCCDEASHGCYYEANGDPRCEYWA